ncbi:MULTISPECIES: Maf-like protein [Acinetobacter]|uniref:dTTP/UTP pyrophosphatase n=1 Tax=Acinetobacter genomosp. 15BJ TaxID=106651 RepID=R9B5N8_9GAMM|nr:MULTISPECIES: Maf-like protein [Acinetobacter]EOR09804.1 septum formation protein Maf [Acinetobacter genomosp. 15BJ]MCH7292069.1 Maf-like protein [Acinetobacter genomosp. 15BJ]MCI3879920.1 Maf-like protein [Acinetobacter higginsii]MDO3656880.1 Maf-like protein [Acinetobacter genomosp. 15BJ]
MAHIILASSSPRRQELLQQLGLDFEIYSPNVDEAVHDGEAVEHYVERLAREKAQVVLNKYADAIVIAADTSLSFAGQIIGKPESKQHAISIWSMLSGQWHDVYSGICVASSAQMLSRVVRTQVELQQLSHAEMEKYWATGEPIGKAGAYAIQGIAAQYIPQIRGSYSNVVGLPLHEIAQLLESVKA